MKIKDSKIVEITETELFALYLDRDMDEVMDFYEYKQMMIDSGCVVIDG